MFSKIIHKFWHKLAFRFTLWYAIIFTASLFGALCVFYIMITNTTQRNIDNDLLDELNEVSATLEFLGTGSAYKAMKIESETEGIDEIFLRLLD